jgi:hypothetical protein
MSKKYQYFAKKRGSHYYFEAQSICKFGTSGNFIKCHICLNRAGRTRRIQK